jgi:hypothetical protein
MKNYSSYQSTRATIGGKVVKYKPRHHKIEAGNTKGGLITVPLTSSLTGLESAVWQQTIFVFSCKTD